jgi:hypothetical protein
MDGSSGDVKEEKAARRWTRRVEPTSSLVMHVNTTLLLLTSYQVQDDNIERSEWYW